MSDGTLVFIKTPHGIVEVSTRSAQLSMLARRVLIMVDGKRPVSELGLLVPPGQIDAIVAQLEALSLIERTRTAAPVAGSVNGVPAAPARAASAPATPITELPAAAGASGRLPELAGPTTIASAARDPMTLEEAKRRAVRELNERLGPAAESIALRIEASRNVDGLRDALREADRLITAISGAAAAQAFLQALRRRV